MTDFDTTTEGRRGLLRPMLWALLFLSASANATMSAVADGRTLFTALGAAFGAVALGSAGALIAHHYRGRRSPK